MCPSFRKIMLTTTIPIVGGAVALAVGSDFMDYGSFFGPNTLAAYTTLAAGGVAAIGGILGLGYYGNKSLTEE